MRIELRNGLISIFPKVHVGHVDGDDIEAVIFETQLILEYKTKFKFYTHTHTHTAVK